MELKDFISETIKQVIYATKDINDETFNKSESGHIKTQSVKINFDVGVIAEEQNNSEKGGKISIANVVSGGLNNSEKQSLINTNRILFVIEIELTTKYPNLTSVR